MFSVCITGARLTRQYVDNGRKQEFNDENNFFPVIHQTCSFHTNLPCAFFALTDQWPKASIPLFDSRSRNLGRVNTVRPLSLSTMYQSQAAVASVDFGEASDPSPQGIQGDDCVNFRLWMESCRRYGLPGCDEQANHIVSGRKTISQVFQEQDQIIRDIARNYSQVRKSSAPVDSEASRQGVQEGYGYCATVDSSDSCVQGVQGLDILHSLINVASPQGIQGDECVQFKLWLENCHRFGITGECEQQLNSIKSGRKRSLRYSRNKIRLSDK